MNIMEDWRLANMFLKTEKVEVCRKQKVVVGVEIKRSKRKREERLVNLH